MPTIALGSRAAPAPRVVLQGMTLAAAVLLWALVSAATVVYAPPLLRLLGFLVITFALIALVLHNARLGMLATLAFLVVLQLLRRLLIEPSGWTSGDPLLLVGPVLGFVLAAQQFGLRRRPVAPDRLSLLVLGVLVLTVLEIPNPAGGGIAGGMTGFLFAGAPLLWFFSGRELASPRMLLRVQLLVLVAGVAVACYGLVQTKLAFPSWDRSWLDITGYDSLNVGNELRAFGPFASSAEYSLFLASTLAVATSWALHGRSMALLAIPPAALALFFASTRSALILGFLGIVVCCGLYTRRPRTALAVIGASLAVAIGGLAAFGDKLDHSASNSGSGLISHQIGGLTDPLNPNSSTLLLHWGLVIDGVKTALHKPLGSGPGASNSGGQAGGSQTSSTEIDISNQFVNTGLAGGLLYGAVFFTAFAWAIRSYFAGCEYLLGVIGIMIASMGQWLIGGHYALSPITWVCIGGIAASTRALDLKRRQVEP